MDNQEPNAANKSVIVYGPAGCGKTTNKGLLAQYYGLMHIEEGIDEKHFIKNGRVSRLGTLFLTTEVPPVLTTSKDPNVLIVPFEEAIKLAKADEPNFPRV